HSFSRCYPDHPHLPSFPTRRSSDLHARPGRSDTRVARATAPGSEPVPVGLTRIRGGSHLRAESVPQLVRRRTGGGARRRYEQGQDRKSTRLNSSHVEISYGVFCLKT